MPRIHTTSPRARDACRTSPGGHGAGCPGPRATTAVCILLLGTVGCAAWSPFAGREKAARERERYGPTADQRIKQCADDAKAVEDGTEEERSAFTKRLATAMLEEHDPRVRCGILEVAAGFDDAAALAVCRGGLQDPDERVRLAACAVWGRRGGSEAVELLATRYRSDQELDVRLRALRALGECRDQTAIPVLARALEDSDPAVQYRAVAALKEVSGRDLGNDVNRWREWAADPEGSSAEWSIAETLRKLF